MAEASSRILIDRSVVRLDGRPFFSFGPRILLTPPEKFRATLTEIARLGFTVVGSPPCSPGTASILESFFDAAEEVGLMVVLIADPRLVEHDSYMAERFRARPSLHSYLLSPRPATRPGLDNYLRDRDSLRAKDLFHPIFVNLNRDQLNVNWLNNQDIYAPAILENNNSNRSTHQNASSGIRRLLDTDESPNRPLFCTDLRVTISEFERKIGIYADDPTISSLPPKSIDWYPYQAELGKKNRRDLMAPAPEILRLQVYDLLGNGARGILMNFHEAMEGVLPGTGKDRLLEAAMLSHEINAFQNFFSEGQPESFPLETGHPRLVAKALRHGLEHLFVVRMDGYEEDYFVDEAYMERTEFEIVAPPDGNVRVWRMDFPEPRELELIRDSSGSLRFLAGPMELTALLMITPGSKRAQEIADLIVSKLPYVSQLVVDQLEVRLAKISHIEKQLQSLRAGIDNSERLIFVRKGLAQSKACLIDRDYKAAYTGARRCLRMLRQVIKYQMAKALSTPISEKSGLRVHLRSNYYNLPRFYKEYSVETARVYMDLT